jgi:hypothetical protein
MDYSLSIRSISQCPKAIALSHFSIRICHCLLLKSYSFYHSDLHLPSLYIRSPHREAKSLYPFLSADSL